MRAWKIAAVIGGICGAVVALAVLRRRRFEPVAGEQVDVDEWSAESFPASDPPARTVLTGATVIRPS